MSESNPCCRLHAGIDDSGVGSAAGPIVAAACLMPLDVNPRGIRDSKDLNNSERVQVFEQMVADPRIAYST
jgi:ribonuclease HII